MDHQLRVGGGLLERMNARDTRARVDYPRALMRRAALLLALALAACEPEPPPPSVPAPPTSSAAPEPSTPAAQAPARLDAIPRLEFNRLAAELDLPFFWIADTD